MTHSRESSWARLGLILAFAVLIAMCHGKTIVLVSDLSHSFGVSPAHASWVVSFVALVAAIGSPFVNWAVGQVGERKSIVFGLIVAALCSFIESKTYDFHVFLALRIIEGVGYITVVLSALALLIHTTRGQRRTTALAFWSVASPLGGAIAIFAVSPLVGGEWRLAFSGHAFVLLLLLALTPLLPSANLVEKAERHTLSQVVRIYANPSILRLAAAVGAPLTLGLGLITILPGYLINQVGIAPATIGLISTIGILSSVLAGIVAGFVLNLRIGPAIVVSSAFLSLVFQILVFTPGISAPVAITANIAHGFFGSFVTAWIFTRIPKMSVHGDVMGAGGIAEQFLYISMFIGPVLLYPLFSLPSHVPFFIAIAVATLLPLFLLPLGNKPAPIEKVEKALAHGA